MVTKIQPISEAIREERKRKGLTQKQLAKAAGTSQVYISLLESGKKSPTVAMLNKIVNGLGSKLIIEFGD